ncbi:MAG: mono/diheme cytochrome c family protein [Kiritimatiellia bacterium]|jgi:mono/diheme cytochrome c family protein
MPANPTSLTTRSALLVLVSLYVSMLSGSGCSAAPCDRADSPLDEDPDRFIDDAAYRCGVLQRDLISTESSYAAQRFENYALGDRRWDALPLRDPASRPLTSLDAQALNSGGQLTLNGTEIALSPDLLPTTEQEWIDLGERVFYRYPVRASPMYETAAQKVDLRDLGFLMRQDQLVGLVVFADKRGRAQVGQTCAQCHASVDENRQISHVRSNRDMNIGAARLVVSGVSLDDLPSEIDNTAHADLARLGPGRADVLDDNEFNPYAFPDFGGLRDMPLLHHNGNWTNTQLSTLAMRCETLFITANAERTRIPRPLAYAVAAFLYDAEPSQPVRVELDERTAHGEQVFAEQGCPACHTPPLYTSEQVIDVAVVGTDASAATSPDRYSGGYRVPSLRGVARLAPYLHDGRYHSLESMFDPTRDGGHRFALAASHADRADLLLFLQTL